MKIFVIILLSVMVYADSEFIIIGNKNESSKKYVKYDSTNYRTLNGVKIDKNCYYENGIVSSSSCYIQTGNIFVSFKNNKNIDLEQFAKENNLTMVKLVNPLYKTILYRVADTNVEIVKLVNSINKKYKKLNARVEWITPRKIR